MEGFFQNKRAVIIGGIILGALIVFFGIAGYFLTQKRAEEPGVLTTGITGKLDVNGEVPSGSTITLMQKETQGNDTFEPFAENVSPTDLNSWQFADAKTGKSYEIQGSLIQNGQVIYLSSPIFVSAPAIDQSISFNIAAANPTGPANATISGSVGIDGYIPPGATLTLQGKKLGTAKFNVVTKGIAAKDEQFISYTTAVAGQTYEVQALLFDANGSLVGQSPVKQITAPASNEELAVNSIAKPLVTAAPSSTPTPTPTNIVTQVTSILTSTPTMTPTPVPPPAIMSGSIQFNGQAPGNSRIVVFQRPSGTQNFQVAVDNIAPANGSTWQWTGGQSGKMYDMIAILKQRQSNGTDQDISDSNVITLAAPASNEVFTINSGYTLSAPTGGITVNCATYNSGSNNWTVNVSFGSMSTAQSYWYEIGLTNGGVELANFTQNATSNGNQSFQQTFQNNTTYYARYAYSNIANLNAGSSQFSPFTATTQLQCNH
jgi:hypothetical protein